MANTVEAVVSFQYLGDLTKLSEDDLERAGYYVGYPCAHGHTIRKQDQHWCYECVHKIVSNICGFDLNYLDARYKHKYATIWDSIETGKTVDCWRPKRSNQKELKRVCMPSYRAAYSKQAAENVTLHKAIYQCAWGDVGTLSVTRTCGNKQCFNPLHMVSSFNRTTPPQVIAPFEPEFKANKLVFYAQQQEAGTLSSFLKRQYKFSITKPELLKETEE